MDRRRLSTSSSLTDDSYQLSVEDELDESIAYSAFEESGEEDGGSPEFSSPPLFEDDIGREVMINNILNWLTAYPMNQPFIEEPNILKMSVPRIETIESDSSNDSGQATIPPTYMFPAMTPHGSEDHQLHPEETDQMLNYAIELEDDVIDLTSEEVE